MDLFHADKFEKRIIAFIDLLGWKRLVEQASSNPETFERIINCIQSLQIHSQLPYSFPKNQSPFFNDYEVSQFSDCIAISMKLDAPNVMNIFPVLLKTLQIQLLWQGLLCRGAITCGDLIHSKSILFGPALTEAVKLEGQANGPRILISESLVQSFNVSFPAYDGEPSKALYCRRDKSDQLFFLNYLETDFTSSTNPSLESHMQAIKDMISVAENRDPKHWPKYQWLIKYFNEVAVKYQRTLIDPLAIV